MTTTRRRPVSWRQKSYFTGSGDDLRPAGKPRPSKSTPGYRFGQFPEWLDKLDIAPRLHQLWNTLEGYAGSKGYCWPSQDTLAARMKCTVRTVRRCLRELERMGAVSTTFHHDKDGTRDACVYSLYYQRPATRPVEDGQLPDKKRRDYRTSSARLPDIQCTTTGQKTPRLPDIQRQDIAPSPASTQLATGERNHTKGTIPKEPDAPATAASSSACGPSEDAAVAAPKGATPHGKHPEARDEAQDERHRPMPPPCTASTRQGRASSAARRELAAPAPRTVSDQFRKEMIAKYRTLSHVSDRIDQALNHRSSLNVLNAEVFVNGWLMRDQEAGAHGQPDRIGAHRPQLRPRDSYSDNW